MNDAQLDYFAHIIVGKPAAPASPDHADPDDIETVRWFGRAEPKSTFAHYELWMRCPHCGGLVDYTTNKSKRQWAPYDLGVQFEELNLKAAFREFIAEKVKRCPWCRFDLQFVLRAPFIFTRVHHEHHLDNGMGW